MIYDSNYYERLRLRNGEEVDLRLVRATDKEAFRRGLAAMSPGTAYRRFLTLKQEFTESELRYLTEVDHFHHFALVAGDEQDHGGCGFAAARFVRFLSAPDTADFAIVVVDRFQRKGLGRAMMVRMAEAARERGVEFLTGEMFKSNTAMFHLIDTLVPQAEWELDGDALTVRVATSQFPPVERE